MINAYLLFVGCLAIVSFVAAMIMHELGHYIYARALGKEVQYKVIRVIINDSTGMHPREKIFFYVCGIALGLLPIVSSTMMIQDSLVSAVYFAVMLVFYFVGSNQDLKKIVKISKNKEG